MSHPSQDSQAPLLDQVAATLGVDRTQIGEHLVRDHATSVWAWPEAGLLVRISPAHHTPALHRALALTHWLHEQSVPVTAPAHHELIEDTTRVASVWTHYTHHPTQAPTPADLGALLGRLHRAGEAPVDLPAHDPLASLLATLEQPRHLPQPTVADLRARAHDLRQAYNALETRLGTGLLHGDAWLGNVLVDADGTARLCDWDEAAVGPREIDLANLHQGRRFGRTDEDLDAFAAAYGDDLRDWDGLPVLVSIRDLHTMGAYIRAADGGDQKAADQLERRISTLDEPEASWVSR
ncbi:phosphotransferase enzyme family protein [Nocardiopsis kunsanensis]|uniref:Aminoglycoside phosphotransferase n=1 Tax=Nocardiopsis kunsanensis TaxID=141693 RepID=A0A918XK20_9ACTN|nr:phosphotransferase [Nocardiopsis kunsanensis]GHD34496.1 aminoglycoside phosphotransferase [Nocardiopsis kunsanensis]